MKLAIHSLLLLIGVLAFAPATAWAQTRILKCVGADGSVSYSSAHSCPGDAQGKEQELPAHRVTMTKDEVNRQRALEHPPQQMSAEERANAMRLLELYGGSTAQPAQRRSTPAPAAAVSYRCTMSGAVWYSHSPCPEAMGGDTYFVDGRRHDVPGLGVEQDVVPRAEACHEMNRMGSSARAGRKMDERASPYEKHIGKDKCQ
ncbi:MAG: hypothetical protein IPO66_16620 [Rhodanobacteraceae bacterium]|nr:hypothetical protein [Rhodanobacteraceae bacterium]